ncbi:MAG TPA: Gfo/Idh/MocA family oxidoreductase, partial [Thermoleophilia bacterium]|nr:Gfo/Idh/MocA family oxidoreductase [Thermoleophilia bacterium]
QLLADDEVDVVYVATPHSRHAPDVIAALEAGKHVLCEKPMALTATQARTMVDAARAHDRFLMEAMWTRFLPHIAVIRDWLARGTLGELVTVTADHGQWFAPDPGFRLFAPELGGGALLDLGVYPVSFASMLLGEPDRIEALALPAVTGVDAQTSLLLGHPGGAHALITTALDAESANAASITGTKGRIDVPRVWDRTSPVVVTRYGADGMPDGAETFEFTHEGNGLRHQAAEVARCVRAGLAQSPVIPLDETLAVMRTMDVARARFGLRYPGEDRREPA